MSDCGACESRTVEWTEVAVEVFEVTGDAYHSGVVSGIAEFGDIDCPSLLLHIDESLTQGSVGADAAGEGDMGDACLLDGTAEFLHEDVNDGLFYASGEVSFMFLDEVGLFLDAVAHEIEERGLESTERVIESLNGRFRELIEGLSLTC